MDCTLITGATGYLGKAYAHALAQKGYNLFLTGRREEKLFSLSEELKKSYNVEVDYFPCDLADEESRSDLFSAIESKGCRFNGLINVAGVDVQKAFLKYSQEKLIFQIRSNFEGAVALTRFVLTRRAQELNILSVSSVNGLYPMPYFAIYSATKGAMIGFFSALRYELKNSGVAVTVVLPGAMPTREDIKEQIKGQGLWGKIAAKEPRFVVEKSLKAVKKNKRICIPGFFNHSLQILLKVVPMSVKIALIGKRWSKIEKDAFLLNAEKGEK